ncbi:MAG TPA: GatB/YqeY domain-containing protein [Thermosulfidibacter takaii]|uniref:GatB/YqeY domain-containing protein n=1 Tax=Thermosulfidibacter takaii TaxID=412593 RepID=A0A7C0U6C1_9BACT|nr:GatB/YqeY domain-containing protein [Thermosulfidibacter takaii]
MSLKDRVLQDMKEAMKARDQLRLSTLRLLVSEIKNREIDAKGELKDEDILALIQKAVKQRQDSIAQYEKGGRQDLAEKEKAEMEILKAYLPEELSKEAILKIIDQAIAATGASSPKEMGRVMREVMPRVKGRADGKLVNELVRKRLAGEV